MSVCVLCGVMYSQELEKLTAYVYVCVCMCARVCVLYVQELEKLTTSMDPDGEKWQAKNSITDELQQVSVSVRVRVRVRVHARVLIRRVCVFLSSPADRLRRVTR